MIRENAKCRKGEFMLEKLPFWNNLTKVEQELVTNNAIIKSHQKGHVLHAGREDCSGLFLIRSGRARTYIITEDGKEITLFRLTDGEVCIFSASCMLKNITFDVWVTAETDIETVLLPSVVYSKIAKVNIDVANYTNAVLSERMSDVMWVLEQILFQTFDKRLAGFLMDEYSFEGTEKLKITHEKIAKHLGSAREVVSRMLKSFEEEGMIQLGRGTVIIIDTKKLRNKAGL